MIQTNIQIYSYKKLFERISEYIYLYNYMAWCWHRCSIYRWSGMMRTCQVCLWKWENFAACSAFYLLITHPLDTLNQCTMQKLKNWVQSGPLWQIDSPPIFNKNYPNFQWSCNNIQIFEKVICFPKFWVKKGSKILNVWQHILISRFSRLILKICVKLNSMSNT